MYFNLYLTVTDITVSILADTDADTNMADTDIQFADTDL